jgi:aspartyl/asparaginyl beta-hydroxylase (cupin superfamily)
MKSLKTTPILKLLSIMNFQSNPKHFYLHFSHRQNKNLNDATHDNSTHRYSITTLAISAIDL